MLSPVSVLVTGTSRGIGLELVRQFLMLPSPPQHVLATCRNPPAAQDLQTLTKEHPSVKILKLDVTDYDSYDGVIHSVEEVVGDNGLNLLINNAATLDRDHLSLKSVTPEVMRKTFESNSIAPLMVIKSALNNATRALLLDLKSDGILVTVLHPGWVRTNMGGPRGQIAAEQSAQGLLSVMSRLTNQDLGGFLDYKGKLIPW